MLEPYERVHRLGYGASTAIATKLNCAASTVSAVLHDKGDASPLARAIQAEVARRLRLSLVAVFGDHVVEPRRRRLAPRDAQVPPQRVGTSSRAVSWAGGRAEPRNQGRGE